MMLFAIVFTALCALAGGSDTTHYPARGAERHISEINGILAELGVVLDPVDQLPGYTCEGHPPYEGPLVTRQNCYMTLFLPEPSDKTRACASSKPSAPVDGDTGSNHESQVVISGVLSKEALALLCTVRGISASIQVDLPTTAPF